MKIAQKISTLSTIALLFCLSVNGTVKVNNSDKTTSFLAPLFAQIWSEGFDALANGATSNTGASAWSTTTTSGTFEVQNGLLFFQGINGGSNATWTSQDIDISSHTNISISYLVGDALDGEKETSDYVRGYYILDNGSRVQFGDVVDDVQTPVTQSITGLNGNTLRIEIDFRVSYGNETYTIDDILVEGTSSGGGSVWVENNSTASYLGEVAIGRSTVPANYKLAVEGNIRTREIRVDQDTWPDYVFKEDYKLLPLDAIQKHIQEKGHLPKIPSAKEVEAHGIELGEMNKLLLEKIEELTLHIIRLRKELDELKEDQN